MMTHTKRKTTYPRRPDDNLPDRLRGQANNVENDGWLTAARLIRQAADELEHYRNNGCTSS